MDIFQFAERKGITLSEQDKIALFQMTQGVTTFTLMSQYQHEVLMALYREYIESIMFSSEGKLE